MNGFTFFMAFSHKKMCNNCTLSKSCSLVPLAALLFCLASCCIQAAEIPQQPQHIETQSSAPIKQEASSQPQSSSNIIAPQKDKEEQGAVDQIQEAIATLHPTEGNSAQGVVHFVWEKAVEPSEGGHSNSGTIRVVADVEGLTPNQKHGFHIHEYGDCSAPDASSAGAHFNPLGFLHGSPEAVTRHVGDLGNLQADAEGKAHYDRLDHVITFTGVTSIIGKSVVVHAQEDDFTSQPAGNAGKRIACGVIAIAKGLEKNK